MKITRASTFVRNKYKLKTKQAAAKRIKLSARGVVTHPTHLSGKTKIYGAKDASIC